MCHKKKLLEKITRKKSTLEYKLDCDENSNTNAQTQVLLFCLGTLPLFQGETNFQSLIYFGIFFLSNLGLPGLSVLSVRQHPIYLLQQTTKQQTNRKVRSRDLVIRIAMNISLLMIVIRLIFEIVRVMSDLGENSDETFLISSQSRSFDALQLDLSVFVVSLLHTTFFQFLPRPSEPPRVLSMRLVAYVSC